MSIEKKIFFGIILISEIKRQVFISKKFSFFDNFV